MPITREMLHNFRVDANKAIEPIAKKYGMAMSVTNISYGADGFKAKIEANIPITGGLTKEQKYYDDMQSIYGLPPRDTKMNLWGKPYTIHSMKPNARKNSIVIKRIPDGKTFVTTVMSIAKKTFGE